MLQETPRGSHLWCSQYFLLLLKKYSYQYEHPFFKPHLRAWSQWVAALALTYSLPLLFGYLFTLHLSVAQNLYDMKRSTFEIGVVQLTGIAPTALFYV